MDKKIKKKIQEFKDESNIEIIMSIMKQNNGYITSKLVDELDIGRQYLSILVKKGVIEKVARGIYIDVKMMEDNFYTLSLELPNAIYSHMTALYFFDIAPKVPYKEYDITVNNNYFNYKLKSHNVFYANKDSLSLGLTEVKTPNGNIVRAYDKERCICDIIRSSSRMDADLIKRSVKEYLRRKDKNLTKLSIYAEKLGVKKKVMDFVELMYE